jgi:tetratricopeptide (TPR) repeat protein
MRLALFHRCRASLTPRLRRLVAATALASLCAGTAQAAEPLRPVVKAPHYGDSLFHFYQEHYFSSITSLMVSQHFERVPGHVDDAEILRGGLLLSYGLHREAGDIFTQLIEKGAAPPVRDRAWFFLAKIRYQRGLFNEAQDAMAKIEKNLPPDLEEERVLLQANLLMAREDFAEAVKVLNGIDKKHPASNYVRYNLGVALVRSGDTKQGSKLLDEVGRTPAANDEARSLRDKANVALGFAALKDERGEDAKVALERVRLNSMLANKALLGFGWAEASLKAPKRALVPWSELADRDASDAAVLEARIALPYAYAELGAYGQSLERYQTALDSFDRENGALDESITAIRSGKLLTGLLARNPGEEMGWFWNIRTLPEMPHAGHLAHVLAQHEFQEAFKNYRDLQFLDRNLRTWADKLTSFEDMLSNRRKAYAERLPQIRSAAREADIAALAKRRDNVASELARVEADTDGNAFANAKQRELLDRLANVRDILKSATNDPELMDAAEKLRRVAGALTWQLAQDYPSRLWEAQKALKAIDTGLTGAREREAALAKAQREEPARFEQFEKRIVELGKRIRAMLPRVAALSREQQGHVQELAVAELDRQKDRLATYVTQARFAVAQLYDRAHLAQEGEHAKKP